MQGIRFITDDKKNIIGAQIDLRTHQNTFDEFFSELITGGRMAGTQGVVFIKDSKGNIWAAQIDLRLHQNTFDEFFSELIVKGAQQPVTPVNPNLARTERVNTVVVAARSFLGTKYQTGGDSLFGIDCSGLTFMAYKTIGVQLPRRSVDQMKSGKAVDRTQLQPGDLVFFATNVKEPNRINHVGLVTKAGPQPSVLHSSSSRGVVEEAMGNNYLAQMFRGAVRVV
jgi:cell wall-associated NlpC family hydrolase